MMKSILIAIITIAYLSIFGSALFELLPRLGVL